MAEKPDQLVLDLPVEPRFGAEDFLVGPPNRTAFELVMRWPDWPDTLLVLQGPRRSGKSHLAALWAERAGAVAIAAPALSETRADTLRDAVAILVEDIDRGIGSEPALFHLINRLRERNGSALVTAATPPAASGVRTPDLLSRLRRAPVARLEPPDDAFLRAVLVKLFHDRQLVVESNVVDYLAPRIERSLDSAVAIVAELDREALRLGRRVTRAIASDLLARGSPEDEEP